MPGRQARARTRYYAFLSYSHQDEELADWLHRELEKFRVPSSLAGRLTANGVIPRRLTPIFRDEHDLSAADDLGDEIEAAIGASQFMIVLCSPAAARSRWTNAEIELFKRTGREGCLLAAVASGEPFASDVPGREEEECFPPALRVRYDRRGRPTAKRAEPLAADLRGDAEERRTGFLKLVAGMLGVGLDELVQRETTRRHRQVAWLAAASLAGMAVTSGLAITAIHARDAARDQRREAEGLVAFMLGDLKDKLEPIGRLDALDGVGAKVLEYYRRQDTSELSDAALLQRSRALSLTADVAGLRGQTRVAERLYHEAIAGTAEAVRRNPNDPQRLFDHAQNFFYLGEIARRRGDSQAAETNYRAYKDLSERMVALQPDNMRWRVEEQNAVANLGIVLFAQRRFKEAATQFAQAVRTIQALSAANPGKPEYQKSFTEALAWLADAEGAAGQLKEATDHRRQLIQLLDRLVTSSGADVEYEEKLVFAHRALGRLYAAQGQGGQGIAELEAAAATGDKLTSTEPSNRQWAWSTGNAHLDLGEQLVVARRFDVARAEIGRGCALIERLAVTEPLLMQWRAGQRSCLTAQTRLALASGDRGGAIRFAQRAAATAKAVQTEDAVGDRYALAKTYRLLGDAQKLAGGEGAARISWAAAADSLPPGAAERPMEMSEHAVILERVGRTAEANAIQQQLSRMAYRL